MPHTKLLFLGLPGGRGEGQAQGMGPSVQLTDSDF